MLKLFHSAPSCSLASAITLAESGLEHEIVHIDLGAGDQQTTDYLKMNPKGRVPVLVTDNGVLTETPAILIYIAQISSRTELAAINDPFTLARIQSFNSYLCSTAHVNHAHNRRGTRWADKESSLKDMQDKVPETMGAAFDLIENDFLAGPWVMGDQFTVCDPYLFTIARWLEGDGVPPSRHPRVYEHMDRMNERTSVQQVLSMGA